MRIDLFDKPSFNHQNYHTGVTICIVLLAQDQPLFNNITDITDFFSVMNPSLLFLCIWLCYDELHNLSYPTSFQGQIGIISEEESQIFPHLSRGTKLISDFVNIKTKWNSLHHIIILLTLLTRFCLGENGTDCISQWSAGATMLNINNYTLSLVLAPVIYNMYISRWQEFKPAVEPWE